MNALLRAVFVLNIGFAASLAWSAEPVPVDFYSLDHTPLKAWLFRPVTPVRGTVVALHGCGGLYASAGARKGQLNARHQAMADMLVGEGYAVLFPDSLTPRGVAELCTQKTGQRSVTQTQRRRDALAALQWVGMQPFAHPDKVAVLGWSHGGSAVLAATDARHPEVAAQALRFALAIAFYPGCTAALKGGYQANTPLTLMLGEKDDWTAPGPCIELGRVAGAQVEVYPDSYHDFDHPTPGVRLRRDVPNGVNPSQGVHVGGNPAAREQAYSQLRQILARAFK